MARYGLAGCVENIAADGERRTQCLIQASLRERLNPVEEILGTASLRAFRQHNECTALFDRSRCVKQRLGGLIKIQILRETAAACNYDICLVKIE